MAYLFAYHVWARSGRNVVAAPLGKRSYRALRRGSARASLSDIPDGCQWYQRTAQATRGHTRLASAAAWHPLLSPKDLDHVHTAERHKDSADASAHVSTIGHVLVVCLTAAPHAYRGLGGERAPHQANVLANLPLVASLLSIDRRQTLPVWPAMVEVGAYVVHPFLSHLHQSGIDPQRRKANLRALLVGTADDLLPNGLCVEGSRGLSPLCRDLHSLCRGRDLAGLFCVGRGYAAANERRHQQRYR